MEIRLTIGTARDRARRVRLRRVRPVVPNHRVELWYLGQLMRVVRALRAEGKRIMAALAPAFPTKAVDALPPRGREELNRARKKFSTATKGAGADVAVSLSKRVLGDVDVRLAANVEASIGLDIRKALKADTTIGPAVREATRDNIELITSIPEEYFDKLQDVIEKAWDEGMAHERLAELVEHVGDVTESRAELIARDQTSKMNSAFNQHRQTSIGIKRYEWQTAGDELVRDSHADLDGEVFSWDDPPIVDDEPAHPGEPINCRCVAAPVMDDEEVAEVEEEVGVEDSAPYWQNRWAA